MRLNPRKVLAFVLTGLVVVSLTSTASALFTLVIDFVNNLIVAFRRIGGSLCVIMFVYGGAKYVYSADDPGGRKQGMSICIAAIIGGIIIVSADTIITSVPIP
jgi:hypothetical protein